MTPKDIRIHPKRDTILFLGLFGLLCSMSVLKYLSLNSSFQDLGIFLNHFFNIARGEWWRTVIVHFQPFMFFWSVLYKIFPAPAVPVIILSLQAAFLSLPIIGLHRYYGTLPALAFALYFPLWFNALFDFHIDHLAVPILFGFFFCLKKDRVELAVLFGILLAFVKEPYALQTIACGIFLIFFYRKYWAGLVLILTGLAVFILFTRHVAPFFAIWEANSMLAVPAFSWLGKTPMEMLRFIIFNPHIIFREIFFEREKVHYLFWIFGSFGFLPLIKPKYLIICLPVLGIALLSKSPNFYGLEYHYTAGLIAPLTIAFAEGLPKVKSIWQRFSLPQPAFIALVILGLIFCNFWKSPSPISRYFWKPNWPYSATSYQLTGREIMIKQAIAEHVPSDPDIVVCSLNSVNWGHLAHRKFLLGFPDGIMSPVRIPKGSDRKLSNLLNAIWAGEFVKPAEDETWADYVVLDLKRAWFVGDKGCVWYHQTCQDNPELASTFLELVQITRKKFNVLFEKDGFLILRRAMG